MSLSRADQSLLTQWWFTIDRIQLAAVFTLIAAGIVISLAASPSAALTKQLPAFYFVQRHVVFVALGSLLIIALSVQSPNMVRRIALLLFVAAAVAMLLVLVLGVEINGSYRWLRFAGLSLQPSEIAKPAFVVVVAWAFAEAHKRHDMPALPIAIGLYVVFAVLLIAQPDIGQTALISLVWAALFVLAGLSLVWVTALAGVAGGGIIAAYLTMPYIKGRIDTFFSGDIDPNSQIGQAYQSFVEGGFFGRGPGEGTIKTTLPDAHTDFIFAVIAEEYGIVVCLALVLLYAVIVFRALIRAVLERDLRNRYAVIGLALLFGFQALINMGVNIGLLPTKGMTLPMISAGGSSIVGISITLGMLLALSRRRPQTSSGYGSKVPSFHPSKHIDDDIPGQTAGPAVTTAGPTHRMP